MVGKRKREAIVVSRSTEQEEAPAADPVDSHDLLRKYFEAQFEPLTTTQISAVSVSRTEFKEDESSDSEWDGISDGAEESYDEDDQAPEVTLEVVDHSTSHKMTRDELEKELRKQFMSTKPPSTSQVEGKSKTKNKTTTAEGEKEEATDALNLKHDLALQRLLKESHLLESAEDLNPTGKNRLRAIDIRMQSIGASDSIYAQKKMPMSHRKGMESKSVRKEETRRREARENGIILEKPTLKRNKAGARRERGIGGPSVGKFAGGTLRLSQRDVRSIQGPRRRVGKTTKKKGRR